MYDCSRTDQEEEEEEEEEEETEYVRGQGRSTFVMEYV